MDSLVVNELASHYEKRILRLTPHLLSTFGLNRSSTTVEIGGQSLSCVPYAMALGKADLLAVLSDRELDLLLTRKDAPSKLMLARQFPGEEKPQVFHIPIRLGGFQRPTPGSPYCLLNASILRMPHEIKEMLVTHFFQVDQADAFVVNLAEVTFDDEDLRDIFHGVHLNLIKEKAVGEGLRILRFTPKTLRLFGEFTGVPPVVGEKLDLYPHHGDPNCPVSGTCTAIQTFPELPHFLLVDLEQTLSLEVVKKLMRYAKTAKTPYLKAP
jgi:hypothetical protein